MQSPAATKYCPRRSCAAFGVESGMDCVRRSIGRMLVTGCAGRAGALWLVADWGSPMTVAATTITNIAVRTRYGIFMGLNLYEGAWGFQVARPDLMGRMIG